MHARLARTSRLAARVAGQVPRALPATVVAPALASSTASPLNSIRLFRTSPFSQDGHIPLPSKPESSTPADAPKEDPSAHAVGEQPGHIPLNEASPSTSPAPSSSPAPVDNATATELPTEEIPAVSSSLDATQSSPASSASSEPAPSPAPIDSEAATTLPTEEIPAVSSSLDASAPPSPQQDAERVARTVFVGGLSWNVDQEWLEDEVLAILDRTDGVDQVRVARDGMGRSKGFAFVELENSTFARQLIGTKPVIDGRQVEFTASTSSTTRPTKPGRLNSPQGDARFPPSNIVWLGNVAWSADEVLLEKIFARFGPITRIGQPKDFETGRTRGIAYIEFETVESAQAAVKVGLERGFRVDGRPVKIDFASAEKRGTNKGRLNNAAGARKPGRRERTHSAAGGRSPE